MKILVRAPNWVGDAVMAIPALAAMRRSRPSADENAEIVVLARPAVADLFRDQAFVDRIWEYDYQGRHRGWWGRERLIAELRRERFDVAVLLQNAFEAAWIAWRAGIPERIGYARDARSLLLTRAVRVPAEGEIRRHEAYYYLELLRRAGWIERTAERIAESDAVLPSTRLAVSEAAREAAESTLLAAGIRRGSWRCAIAPGASYGAAKCWPVERFALLADRLISESAADVILLGASGEKEIADKISSAMKCRPVSLVGRTSMRDLAALLSACSIFIGNDSGAMHVAAAVGLPVIGIFGPTDPEGTAPVTDQFILIRQPVSCSPCFLRTCPIDHRCMTRIDVDSVFAAAEQIRDAARLSSHSRGGPNV